jgi:hypothetical protein
VLEIAIIDLPMTVLAKLMPSTGDRFLALTARSLDQPSRAAEGRRPPSKSSLTKELAEADFGPSYCNAMGVTAASEQGS